MHKTTKGALAAAAAAALLIGGGSTLAYWTDLESIDGATISSGELSLGTPDCGAGWTLDGGSAFTTQRLVPGDTLTKVCTIDLVAAGDHLAATLAVDTPTWSTSNSLTSQLDAAAVFTVNGVATTQIDSGDDTGTDEIRATVTVEYDGTGATNASQNLTAELDAVSITATQSHSG